LTWVFGFCLFILLGVCGGGLILFLSLGQWEHVGKGKKIVFYLVIVQKGCVLTMFLAAQKSNFDMHCKLFDYSELDRYSGF